MGTDGGKRVPLYRRVDNDLRRKAVGCSTENGFGKGMGDLEGKGRKKKRISPIGKTTEEERLGTCGVRRKNTSRSEPAEQEEGWTQTKTERQEKNKEKQGESNGQGKKLNGGRKPKQHRGNVNGLPARKKADIKKTPVLPA